MFASSSSPPIYLDHWRAIKARYDAGIKDGSYQPYVYPWLFLPYGLVFIYLLIPHRNSPLLKLMRWPVWLFMVACGVYSIMYCKGRNVMSGYFVGLISTWGTVWLTKIMIIYDCQTYYQRIKRREKVSSQDISNAHSSLSSNGHADVNMLSDANGLGNTVTNRNKSRSKNAEESALTQKKSVQRSTFIWQPYPTKSLADRLSWVGDIFCNFRGMGWNFQISGLPPLPLFVRKDLENSSSIKISQEDSNIGRNGTRRHDTRRELVYATLQSLATWYIVLDFLKVFMMKDPYFWGLVDQPPPSYLPKFVRTSGFFTHSYRLIFSHAGVIAVMSMGGAFLGLVMGGILGPQALGVRGESWMYPDTWGAHSNIFNRGLAGWWGEYWHQTLRLGFDAPSKKLNAALGIDHKSWQGRLIQLVSAFTISGMVHASGSYTEVSDSRPLTGSFLFFSLQPFGIAAQAGIAYYLEQIGVLKRTPKVVRQTVNLVYVYSWFYFTGHLLCDDFARCGIWFVEPVPVSPLRIFVYGSEADDGWWCWGVPSKDWARWHNGKYWWQTGWAI